MTLVDDLVDALLERRDGGQRRHRRSRHHHLVDAPVAELDDRGDHLLFFRLQDPLLAAAPDQELELLRAHCRLADLIAPQQARDGVRGAGQEPDERGQDPKLDSTKPLSVSAKRSVCARARLLGTSSPKTIVNSDSSSVTTTSAIGVS